MKTTQTLLTVLGSLALAGSANAQLIAQWNFNSNPPDASTSTGTLTPSVGSGTASLIGGTTSTFASGDASGGSTDPATGDDSGWNVTTFPSQGSGNRTAGVQFTLSGPVPWPVGATGLEVKWDQRHSNTASRYARFQYSTDGTSWTDGSLYDANAGGDKWYNARTETLSGVVPSSWGFAFRIVSEFAPSTSQYAPSTTTVSYGTGGTWRFDMVTVSAIPEPHEYAMLAGLGLVGFAIWRRRAAKS